MNMPAVSRGASAPAPAVLAPASSGGIALDDAEMEKINKAILSNNPDEVDAEAARLLKDGNADAKSMGSLLKILGRVIN